MLPWRRGLVLGVLPSGEEAVLGVPRAAVRWTVLSVPRAAVR
ncbi:hypothetical protein [Streptomyces sp. NPDC051310]